MLRFRLGFKVRSGLGFKVRSGLGFKVRLGLGFKVRSGLGFKVRSGLGFKVRSGLGFKVRQGSGYIYGLYIHNLPHVVVTPLEYILKCLKSYARTTLLFEMTSFEKAVKLSENEVHICACIALWTSVYHINILISEI